MIRLSNKQTLLGLLTLFVPFFVGFAFLVLRAKKFGVIDTWVFFSLLIELTILLVLFIKVKKSWFWKALLAVIALLHICQVCNFYVTGILTQPETLTNLQEARSLGDSKLRSIILFAVCYSGLLIYYASYYNIFNRRHTENQSAISTVTIGSILVFFAAEIFIPLPAISLTTVVMKARDQILFSVSDDGYQYKKDYVSLGPIPDNVLKKWKGNIIVIFSEGLSRRILSPDLTPNIYNLEKNSLSLTGYYNHTAATFRGLRGQLVSGYQYLGGFYTDKSGIGQMTAQGVKDFYKDKAETIPNILNNYGYETVFISPHGDGDNFNDFCQLLGFQKIISPKKEEFTDKKLYDALLNKALESNNKNKKFFLATYILGTHEGLDSPDKKYGDGSNPYLNKFHNADYWLGDFLNKFKKSPLYDNTLVIFTADHSTYQSAPMLEAFNIDNGHLGQFVDEMPLCFFAKGISPRTIDVDGRNSLGFAPTLLNILGISSVENHFLGSSLFNNSPTKFEFHSAVGDTMYNTKHKIIKKISDPYIRLYYKYSG